MPKELKAGHSYPTCVLVIVCMRDDLNMFVRALLYESLCPVAQLEG